MRKIFAFIVVSVDGYHAGPNREVDWHHVDEEFEAFSMEQLGEADTLLFGRATYEVMAAHWPKQQGTGIAGTMNGLDKIVISRTLEKAGWTNTRLVSTNVEDELTALKRRPGKDIAILGSSTLTAGLLPTGLIDELRLLVNPIVLGEGRSLLNAAGTTRLELTKTRPFRSGSILLCYRPHAAPLTS
ncbi:dihydrofolate reductase family protein [Actinomadura adrarensis]|uniref:Dihydrofolate reductase family protein n=1 Tax=Actinomadura adrarensis TaxID=1819600 RepID=A0ABW3CNG5_9ACTN